MCSPTNMLALIDSASETVKQSLRSFVENRLSHNSEMLTPELVEEGRTCRLKDAASSKAFLTIFGEVEFDRRYYHCGDGGRGIVPLDEAWRMQDRYATPEIVENLLWASSVLVPKELGEFCARRGRFKPSASCIQDIIRRDGAGIAKT